MKADLKLLEDARSGDKHALVKIFDLYAPVLYKYVFRLCRDASMADDVVGEVFIKFLEHLSAGTGPSTNLRSYLFEMAYHLVVDHARSSHRTVPIDAVDLMHHDRYSIEATAENRMLFQAVRRAIGINLTGDQRHVVILRILEGLSHRETAALLGKEVGNVKVIQVRALSALRKALNYRAPEMRAAPGD